MDRYGVVFTVAPSESCDGHDDNCLTFQDSQSRQDSGHSTPESGHSPIHWRGSLDLEKSRNRNRDTRERCLCCLFCFFMVSSASLAALVLLLYTGQVKFQLLPGNKPRSNGYPGTSSLNVSYANIDGMAKTLPRVCAVPGCIETAAAVLTRIDHSIDPCEDFYSYACGGYIRRTPLTWNVTRIRENPDDIQAKYKDFLIDKLSASRRVTDSSAISQLKTVFRSCLLRSPSADRRSTKRSVSEMLTKLGGLHLLDSSLDEEFDMTSLIANVTRLYGASPFFKVIVHGRARISLINHYSDQLVDDLKAMDDDMPSFRFLLPSAFQEKDIRRSKVLNAYHDFLLQYVSSVIDLEIDARVRRALDEVFVFELELNKLLYDPDSEMTEQPCQNMRFTAVQYLKSNYGGYMIRWEELLQNILGVASLAQTTFCDIYLKTQLQDLLEITPKYLLKRYIIIHTLVHTDLFPLVSKHLNLDMSFTTLPSRSIRVNPNEECVEMLVNVLPTRVICQKNMAKAKAILRSLFSTIHSTLSQTLSSLFGIPVRDSGKIVNRTMDEVVEEWVSVEMFNEQIVSVDAFSKDNFVGNFLRLSELRNGRYFDGQKKKTFNSVLATVYEYFSGCTDLPGLPGPLSYPSTVPSGIHFGSLGSYLTRQIADKLDIQVLLDHYADDILNDSAVLYLAVRLQCLVTLYNRFDMLHDKLTTYSVDGETTKNENWKDHLALKVSYQSWFKDTAKKKRATIIPGLTENEKQLFFILHAQTMCEKTNDRGIMKYYIRDESQLSPPNKYRVNGAMMNFRPFTEAFRCPLHSSMNPDTKCPIF